jgi:hypothetical protein
MAVKKGLKTMSNRIISYENGAAFYHDLCACYGKEQGRKHAIDYLTLQETLNDNFNAKGKENNHEEFIFCCELYHAMNQ